MGTLVAGATFLLTKSFLPFPLST